MCFTCMIIFHLEFEPPAKHARNDTTEMCNSNPTNTGNFKGTITYKTCDI